MKAKVISQIIYDSVLDFAHNAGHRIKRLIIEGADNLAIAIYRDRVIVLENFKLDGDCEVLGEVEVTDQLVKKAQALLRAQKRLDYLKSQIEKLTNLPT